MACAIAAAASGCGADDVDRAAINDAVQNFDFPAGLSLRVRGGAVLETTAAAGDCPPGVVVRAQSLDPRVLVEDGRCGPQALHLTVTHLPRGALTHTARPFLAGAEGDSGGADAVDPDWTALAPETPFEVVVDEASAVAGVSVKWTLCTDRNQQAWRLLSGHRPIGACRFATVPLEGDPGEIITDGACDPERAAPPLVDPGAGACTTFDTPEGEPLALAPLVVRHRLGLEVRPDDCVRFATWGNNAAHPDIRRRITEAVTAADPLFAVITGDLTAEGTTIELAHAQRELDRQLQIPWYATLGDREAVGAVADNYAKLLGASTFAFDAGAARLIVLDSGDRGLFADDRRQLARWLEPDGRLWWDAPAPATRLVFTHVPPFDPEGARGDAFRHRPEAAAFTAALLRGGVPLLFSSQFAIYAWQSVAGTRVVHSGGGGAPMELTSGDPNHWLLVTVDPGCADPPACARPEAGCPCVDVHRVDVGASPPDLEPCRPAASEGTGGF